MNKLNVKALAIALGTSWGLCMMIAGWAAIFGWAAQFVDVMTSVYSGYGPSFTGGVIGALWGFADGAIAGVLIALIYNVIAKD